MGREGGPIVLCPIIPGAFPLVFPALRPGGADGEVPRPNRTLLRRAAHRMRAVALESVQWNHLYTRLNRERSGLGLVLAAFVPAPNQSARQSSSTWNSKMHALPVQAQNALSPSIARSPLSCFAVSRASADGLAVFSRCVGPRSCTSVRGGGATTTVREASI